MSQSQALISFTFLGVPDKRLIEILDCIFPFRKEMVGDRMLASQILPPTVEICENATQLQPIEEGDSLFECTIEEPSEIIYSTPRTRPVLSQHAQYNSDEYKAEKKRLKLQRLRLKNANLELKNLKLKKEVELLSKQLMQS